MGGAGGGIASVAKSVFDGRVRIRSSDPWLEHADNPCVQLHFTVAGSGRHFSVYVEDRRFVVHLGTDSSVPR